MLEGVYAKSCQVMSCHVMPCLVMSYLVACKEDSLDRGGLGGGGEVAVVKDNERL